MSKYSALLDTSFFIRLLNPKDLLHQNAIDYYQYFLEHDYILKISTIAVAEYCVKGDISELPLRNLQILPFNVSHAIVAGKIASIAFKEHNALPEKIVPRAIIPNDCKMFAQADTEDSITHFVSADSRAKKVWSLINKERKLKFDYIDISTQVNVFFGELF